MEGKEYLTYEEAMEYLGCKRSTLYTLITDLGITTHKFKRDKRRYLAASDVMRLKEIKEKPWIAGEKVDKPPAA
jgi:excisionase family DNA binding protein